MKPKKSKWKTQLHRWTPSYGTGNFHGK